MNKKVIILVALIIVVSAIGLPLYLLNNRNSEDPDLQVTLKSCEYNSYNEEYDLHLFTVVIHIQPIRFTTLNTFRVQYANISDDNEQKQIKSTSINRNNTAEDYTYWFGFSLREINEPVELTLLFSIFETDLTGQKGLAVPNFSKTLTLNPKIVPIEEEEPENRANFEIQFLYNTSINDYDRVNLTLYSQESGTGELGIVFSTYENFTAGNGGEVKSVSFKDVTLKEGVNNIIPPSNLIEMFSDFQDGYVIIRHITEPIEIQTLASGLMPPIEYEDIPNP